MPLPASLSAAHQFELALRLALRGRFVEQRLHGRTRALAHPLQQRRSGHFRQRHAEHLREAPVGVEDEAVGGDRQRALAHLLDEDAIRRVGAFEREDAIAVRTGDDDRVHFTRPDRAQRLLCFGQPRTQ